MSINSGTRLVANPDSPQTQPNLIKARCTSIVYFYKAVFVSDPHKFLPTIWHKPERCHLGWLWTVPYTCVQCARVKTDSASRGQFTSFFCYIIWVSTNIWPLQISEFSLLNLCTVEFRSVDFTWCVSWNCCEYIYIHTCFTHY